MQVVPLEVRGWRHSRHVLQLWFARGAALRHGGTVPAPLQRLWTRSSIRPTRAPRPADAGVIELLMTHVLEDKLMVTSVAATERSSSHTSSRRPTGTVFGTVETCTGAWSHRAN